MGTFLLACSLVTACSGWFDVSPKTDLKADEMFSTESGFESSLTGIYLLMTDQGAYGGNMSFGLLDQLAQQYDYIPGHLQLRHSNLGWFPNQAETRPIVAETL